MQALLSTTEKLFIDATERRIQRPGNQVEQRDAYSGKKKAHTLKNTVISDINCFILFLSSTVWGGMYHDYSLLKKDFPPSIRWFKKLEVWLDSGYLGFQNEYPVRAIHQPQKKPRKSKNNPNPALSEEQKIENRNISKVRCIIEHAIAGMKRYNILIYPLRTKCERFIDRIIGICAGLWNFKISLAKI